jgi:hypothetical protein
MKKPIPQIVLAMTASAAVLGIPALAQECIVPTRQLFSGGPGKDGIPSLRNPLTVSASVADRFLTPDALVLGVSINGESRAYPHNILWWHEIVNDELGGERITVSYCPLTGSGMVYGPVVDGRALVFGVSGLLFENNLVLFDRGSESLWSQMQVQAICGSLSETRPTLLPVVQSTWQAWKSLHPDTTVVGLDTGYRRNYDVYPYGTYDQLFDDSTLFPVGFLDARLSKKELVLGIVHDGVTRAYPYEGLGERTVINDDVAGRAVMVVYDRGAKMAVAFDRQVGERLLSFEAVEGAGFPFLVRDLETGSNWDLTGLAVDGELSGTRIEPVATYSAMWFAWAVFHQGTEIYGR